MIAVTNLDILYPSIDDLRIRAKKRIPHFAFEYLDSGTGQELGVARNREALDSVKFLPEILHGNPDAAVECEFMGQKHPLPIGIAPVGMSGLLWPGAERRLAKAAKEFSIPYCMSTVAVALPEEIGPYAEEMGWFQLYTPSSDEVRRDILKRVANSGFKKLVVTVDVPGESRRERQRRAYMGYPPRLTPTMILSMIMRPVWSLNMLAEGKPSMKFIESYVDKNVKSTDPFLHAARILRGYPDWNTIKDIRQEWDGDILVKGVQRPQDAFVLRELGIDGIWVSNHSGRQFDAGPPVIQQLPKIRKALGDDFPIIYDSGVMSGLDVIRALALGADIVFMARAFHYAIAALSDKGIRHLIHIIDADMRSNMAQIGANSLSDLADKLIAE